MNALAFQLSDVPWAWFVTLTFRGRGGTVPAKGKRVKALFTWLRTIARHKRMHFGQLLWVVREEFGELNGRQHFHVLVGGFQHDAFDLWAGKNSWKLGIAHVTRYASDLSGVAYLLKGDSPEQAMAYEINKTGRPTAETVLSHSVMRLLQEKRATGHPPQQGATVETR